MYYVTWNQSFESCLITQLVTKVHLTCTVMSLHLCTGLFLQVSITGQSITEKEVSSKSNCVLRVLKQSCLKSLFNLDFGFSAISYFFQHWHVLAVNRLSMSTSVWFHQQGDMGEDGPKGEMGEKVCKFHLMPFRLLGTCTKKQRGSGCDWKT